jgi:hypothetical protein
MSPENKLGLTHIGDHDLIVTELNVSTLRRGTLTELVLLALKPKTEGDAEPIPKGAD